MCFMFRSIDLCAGCDFSIKSDLGNPPTLLNAGKSTNFIYAVNGLTKESAEKIETALKIICLIIHALSVHPPKNMIMHIFMKMTERCI